MNFNAVREVGDIVRVGGPWFDSLARVTAFHAQADPTMIDFVIVEANNYPHVQVGEVGSAPAGACPVIGD